MDRLSNVIDEKERHPRLAYSKHSKMHFNSHEFLISLFRWFFERQVEYLSILVGLGTNWAPWTNTWFRIIACRNTVSEIKTLLYPINSFHHGSKAMRRNSLFPVFLERI